MSTFTPLFALIIGIDIYRYGKYQSLKGAVADARKIEKYLKTVLKVPQAHITFLSNEAATRKPSWMGSES